MTELPRGVTTLTPEDPFTYVWVSGLLEQVLEGGITESCGWTDDESGVL
jgi:hypothetical protein